MNSSANLVEQAVLSAMPIQKVSAKELADQKRQLAIIQEEIKNSLPIEAGACQKLKDEEARLKKEIGSAEARYDFIAVLPQEGIKPQLLSKEVFGWRHKNGTPKLMPFAVNSKSTESTIGDTGFYTNDAFPTSKSVRDLYMDVVSMLKRTKQASERRPTNVGILMCLLAIVAGAVMFYLANLFWNDWTAWDALLLGLMFGGIVCFGGGVISISFFCFPISTDDKYRFFVSAKFSGLIPERERQIIKKSTKYFDEMFILAEVPQMEIQMKLIPLPTREPDPLIVGVKGDDLYLIAKFDTTTIEQLVADEFAEKPEEE